MKTDSQKKLALQIVDDVQRQLKSGFYIPTVGRFCEIWEPQGIELGNSDILLLANNYRRSDSMKDLLEKAPQRKLKCNVCALGSLFTSYIGIKNQVTIEDFQISALNPSRFSRIAVDKLKEAFTEKELVYMEKLFEGGTSSINAFIDYEDPSIIENDAIRIWADHNSVCMITEIKILKTILTNIKRNKGEFKIPRNYIRRAVKKNAMVS